MEEQKDKTLMDSAIDQRVKDAPLKYVSQKAEKLTSAIYLVTDFLSDNEPLKWKLRDAALLILTDTRSQLNSKLFFHRIPNDNLWTRIESIVSLLDVALVGSAVSQMNFSVIKSEYQTLLKYLGNLTDVTSLTNIVKLAEPADTNVQVSLPSVSPRPVVVPERKYSAPVQTNYNRDSRPDFSKGHSQVIKDIGGTLLKNEDKINLKKESRRDTIINFIRGKDWTSIADIAQNFPDCSAKTVQRELADLVQSGILKKQGEKRWSRYSLV